MFMLFFLINGFIKKHEIFLLSSQPINLFRKSLETTVLIIILPITLLYKNDNPLLGLSTIVFLIMPSPQIL